MKTLVGRHKNKPFGVGRKDKTLFLILRLFFSPVIFIFFKKHQQVPVYNPAFQSH
jgi:hypothetical protein